MASEGRFVPSITHQSFLYFALNVLANRKDRIFLFGTGASLVLRTKPTKRDMGLTLSPNTSRDLRHLVWRISQVEQLGPPHPPALLSTSAPSTLNDLDFLHVR